MAGNTHSKTYSIANDHPNGIYAHNRQEEESTVHQTLRDHLSNVASIAGSYAESLGVRSFGESAGLLHDSGKISDQFQERLNGANIKVDHSTLGAFYVKDCCKPLGTLLAYSIAGHHGGIPNGAKGNRTSLMTRLSRYSEQDRQQLASWLEREHLVVPELDLQQLLVIPTIRDGFLNYARSGAMPFFSLFVFAKMIHSCLVDGDYSDTEQFMAPDQSIVRTSTKHLPLKELLDHFNRYLSDLTAKSDQTSPVVQARNAVSKQCEAAASLEPGFFSLTVPTGGGKTLAAMNFALHHAVSHNKDRIIVAAPYTAIIEQTAQGYRKALGESSVLEHHSNFDFTQLHDDSDGAMDQALLNYRLATQTWDIPLVVTTNVQLFESLYSNKPSKSRKVHNIANSVIVLDEVQSLPDSQLKAVLAMLEELVKGYRCTVVLCTATQPALDLAWSHDVHVHEIVSDKSHFDEAFSDRVAYHNLQQIDQADLVTRLLQHQQILCVVGTKPKAAALYEELRVTDEDNATFHLSAAMTPDHRTKVIKTIKERLSSGKPCRVVATQLIEAGVDIDFPTVFRELAGMDSIVQCAGRCNREGKLPQGHVYVFELAEDKDVPDTAKSWLEKMKDISRSLIRLNHGVVDDTLVRPFFERRYLSGDLDARGVLSMLSPKENSSLSYESIPFETIAEQFKLVDDSGETLFIPYGDNGLGMLEKILAAEFPGTLAAQAQRMSISVPAHLLNQMRDQDMLIETIRPFIILKPEHCPSYYRDDIGFVTLQNEPADSLMF